MNPMFSMPQEEHSKTERMKLSLFVYVLTAHTEKYDELDITKILEEAGEAYEWISDDADKFKTNGGQYL